jgi:hypothetical protein
MGTGIDTASPEGIYFFARYLNKGSDASFAAA